MPTKTVTYFLAISALAGLTLLAGCRSGKAPGSAAQRPRPRVTVTIRVTPSRSLTWYAQRHQLSATPSASPGPAISLGCKVLQTGVTEQFSVTTIGGGSYSGTVYVSFYDYAGSGHIFPGTTVNGATPAGAWYPVPAADIGASAEPSGCIASAG
jgi:hypothetical protein